MEALPVVVASKGKRQLDDSERAAMQRALKRLRAAGIENEASLLDLPGDVLRKIMAGLPFVDMMTLCNSSMAIYAKCRVARVMRYRFMRYHHAPLVAETGVNLYAEKTPYELYYAACIVFELIGGPKRGLPFTAEYAGPGDSDDDIYDYDSEDEYQTPGYRRRTGQYVSPYVGGAIFELKATHPYLVWIWGYAGEYDVKIQALPVPGSARPNLLTLAINIQALFPDLAFDPSTLEKKYTKLAEAGPAIGTGQKGMGCRQMK